MHASPRPYFNNLGIPVLRESVILVADILGYKQKMQHASNEGLDSQFLELLYQALNKAFKNVDDLSDCKWFAKMVSDDLVVGYPILDDGAGTFELSMACSHGGHFQLEMMEHGFPVRGGICFGNIHISELLFFPDGIVFKEILDSEAAANYPRIVLMHSSKDFVLKHWGSFTEAKQSELRSFLLSDNDGAQFVNYLMPLSGGIDNRRIQLLKKHKKFIEVGMEKFCNCDRIYQKYFWTANYHNKFCRSVAGFNKDDFFIDKENVK